MGWEQWFLLGLQLGLRESSVSLSLTDAGRFRLAGCSGVFFFTGVLSLVVSSSSCRFCFFCVGYTNSFPYSMLCEGTQNLPYIIWENTLA